MGNKQKNIVVEIEDDKHKNDSIQIKDNYSNVKPNSEQSGRDWDKTNRNLKDSDEKIDIKSNNRDIGNNSSILTLKNRKNEINDDISYDAKNLDNEGKADNLTTNNMPEDTTQFRIGNKRNTTIKSKVARINVYGTAKHRGSILTKLGNNTEPQLSENRHQPKISNFLENKELSKLLLPLKFQEDPNESKEEQNDIIEKFSIVAGSVSRFKQPYRELILPIKNSLLQNNQQLVNVLSEYTEVRGLCADHFISLNRNPKPNLFADRNIKMNARLEDEHLTSSNNFFTKTLIYVLEVYAKDINDYLSHMLPDSLNNEDLTFFRTNYSEYNDRMEEANAVVDFRFNFIGFKDKRYFYKSGNSLPQNFGKLTEINMTTNNNNNNVMATNRDFLSKFNLTKETEEKPIPTILHTKNISEINTLHNEQDVNKSECKAELLIVNMTKAFLQAGYFFAIRIFSSGKTYAGLIDENLNFQGCGIYISKSGNIISGVYENNDIKYGKCLSFKFSSLYDGQLEKMKRDGKGYEEAELYEFAGEYSKGKKIKGRYTIKDVLNKDVKLNKGNLQVSKIYKVISIEIDRKMLGNKVRAYIKNQDGTMFSYFGAIKNGKFYDDTAQLIFDIENPYPRYDGSIVDNFKQGKGKYIWSDKMSVKGLFKNNKVDTFKDRENLSKFLDNMSDNHSFFEKSDIEKAEINYNNQQFDGVFTKGTLIYFKKKEEVI